MRVNKTKTYLDKDIDASTLNLWDFMNSVFSVLNFMEKDEVQETLPSISDIPSHHFNIKGHQQLLAKAFVDLESHLKMPS